MSPRNPLELSDDEFLKLGMPPAEETPVVDPEVPVVVEGAADAGAAADPSQPTGDAPVADSPAADGAAADPGADPAPAPVNPLELSDEELAKTAAPTAAVAPAVVAEAPVAEPAVAADLAAAVGDKPAATPAADGAVKDPTAPVEEVPVDHEAFYKRVMAPFKANGKDIQLKSPEEAVALMQMGANYTRKMQELVPHRKLLTMLQNNSITEDRLSFLIDLDKKNPEAVKKLLKDSGIDPMELDVSGEPAYLEGNHRVTDEEVNFRSAMDELSSHPEGQRTLLDINTRWDQASKEQLWKQPETMDIIHRQRSIGADSPQGSIYDRVVAEIDRRSTLGQLPPGTPFLSAYQTVGQELTSAGAFKDLNPAGSAEGQPAQAPAISPVPAPAPAAPQPVATRVAAPKPTLKDGDKAGAAASARSTPRVAKDTINPLAMSDDEFLKQFEGRF